MLVEKEVPAAIYIHQPRIPYLAKLQKRQNSLINLRGHGPERMRRLQSRIAAPVAPLHTLSTGELAAMGWLVESWTKRDAVQRFGGRVMALDFDQFLSAVADNTGRILTHFGLPHDARYLAAVGRSPVLTRYSKAPEYAYTPSVRAEVLRDSRRHNSEEIRKGMDWLERRARSDRAVAEIVNGADA